jgi:hypothetical protein
MRPFTRMIIVRRGEAVLFERLRDRFADDAGTVILYDRREPARGTRNDGGRSGNDNRRWPQDDRVLFERGFYVVSRVPAALGGPPPNSTRR